MFVAINYVTSEHFCKLKLKAVEMHGFKSFPNKTKIEFGDGITAIIGPNGSGKSNVSDAVRWVLGEMSMKSLRGNRMEDIIFNGAAGFSPSGASSVSLILDTSEEYSASSLNEAEEVKKDKVALLEDAPEISITRKYYRNSDSEYYINKKQVRLKDIYELFYDTGIGREGYSVIGQGKISEVLSQKDEDRRSIFEEAAGISKYRYKKLEAERKLKDTENNLVRINDIVGEISSRIGPLQKEAENAKKYLILSEEKKGLELTLWLEKVDKLREKLSENEIAKAATKQKSEQLNADLASLEKELDASIQDTYEMSRQTSENERKTAEIKQSVSSLDGEKAVLENEISHLNRIIEENKESAETAASEEKNIASNIYTVTEKYNVLKSELERKQKEYEGLHNKYSTEKSVLAESVTNYNRLIQDKQSKSDELSKQKITLATKTAQKAAFGDRIAALTAEIDTSEQKCELLERSLKETGEKADNTKSAADDLRKECDNESEEITKLKKSVDIIETTVNEKRFVMAGKEQKRDSLERLEQLFEGYSDSVKTLLTASKNFELKCRVYGTVSSVINTDSEFVVALECALGAAVQYVIVGDEDDAKQCINYLKQHNSGRATFLPLTTVKGSLADTSKIKKLPGFIGLASEIISTDEKFRVIANDLLGRTVIADNIDNAANLARACDYRIKIVTKDGQVIHAGGHFTGGSEMKRTGILTRALDIEKLNEEIKLLNEKLLDDQVKQNSIEREIQKKKQLLSEKLTSLSELEKTAAAQNSEYVIAAATIAEERKRNEQLNENLNTLVTDGQTGNSELEELTASVMKLEAEITDIDRKIEAAKVESDKRDEADRALLDDINNRRFELAHIKNELEKNYDNIKGLEASKEAVREKIKQSNNAAIEAEIKIIDTKARIDEIEATKSSVESETVKINEQLKQLIIKQEKKQEQINNLRHQSKKLSVDKDEAFREYTNIASKDETWNSEYEQILSKLWDEYEMSYSQANEFRLPSEKMEKAATRLSSIKNQVRSLGSINVNAVEEYKTTKERYDILTTQLDDLNKTRKSLDSAIEKLETNMKTTFADTFYKINSNFGQVFGELFGGGTAYVELIDPNDPLGSGIDIIVKPPGKTIKNISLLSGGEQSFAAIALYLSLQRINPAPFCIFDEIDTALDEVNVNKLADFVRRHCEKTQFIFITHRRGTMERADRLYGITMPHKGVSEYLKLDLTRLHDQGQKEFVLK
ncbi:MAG: chromosome segregation protein SMC [Clostridiales bacterium GWF2_38_85]|nr:MAG: chromosome segregation protein SMC [Clostridiales bacterium GWF2_38_85]HBL83885.1 chromosome segregation protein SMC [Clostridiales bacterium]